LPQLTHAEQTPINIPSQRPLPTFNHHPTSIDPMPNSLLSTSRPNDPCQLPIIIPSQFPTPILLQITILHNLPPC
jgi:hypothetical protein